MFWDTNNRHWEDHKQRNHTLDRLTNPIRREGAIVYTSLGLCAFMFSRLYVSASLRLNVFAPFRLYVPPSSCLYASTPSRLYVSTSSRLRVSMSLRLYVKTKGPTSFWPDVKFPPPARPEYQGAPRQA